MVASILWRRLDTPGHDACRLEQVADGWRLAGAAVFRHEGMPAQLAYSVVCDSRWHARQGRVEGWIGDRILALEIIRTPEGRWFINGAGVSDVRTCPDLDFGFTPATNLLQLRRLNLAVGQAADAPVLWLDPETETVDLLPQRYERRSETAYWYESPSFGYAALLEVTPTGFVSRYPDLWAVEA